MTLSEEVLGAGVEKEERPPRRLQEATQSTNERVHSSALSPPTHRLGDPGPIRKRH